MNRKKKRGIIIYLIFLSLVVFLFKVVLMLNFVPSGSMEGTIKSGNFLISTRFDVQEEELERYDILIFTPPDSPEKTYIKRLIGMPGETIEVKNGKVFADGVELDSSFQKGPQNRTGDGVYVVPEGCYFFLGDNRNNSNDSRFWNEKYIPLENIQAKARFIIFPFKDVKSL